MSQKQQTQSRTKKSQAKIAKELKKIIPSKTKKPTPHPSIHVLQPTQGADFIDIDTSHEFWKKMNAEQSPQSAWEDLFGKIEDSIPGKTKDLFLQLYTPRS